MALGFRVLVFGLGFETPSLEPYLYPQFLDASKRLCSAWCQLRRSGPMRTTCIWDLFLVLSREYRNELYYRDYLRVIFPCSLLRTLKFLNPFFGRQRCLWGECRRLSGFAKGT